jgi:hypothetical protein
MGFFKKKEEKKKFDYSEDTKELFAERDAFYSEMRQKMGGEASNPEASKVSTPETSNKQDDLDDLLGGGDFNPYVNKEEGSMSEQTNVPAAAPPSSSSSSAFSCQSCGKEFQEKWGKCPSCGGEMKKAAAPEPAPAFTPVAPETSTPPSDLSSGDPLDDLLGDFGSGTTDDSSDDTGDTDDIPDSNIRNSGDDLGTDFGSSRSSHSNRKIRKVKKVKRPRTKL